MPHIHEKIDFTAEVFVVHNNKVLLRKHDKYKVWLSVGGHIELDEYPNQAAAREVKEEVGLTVKLFGQAHVDNDENDYKELVPPMYLNRHRISPSHEHVTMVYFATSNTEELVLSSNEKSDECRWFTRQELAGLKLRKNVAFYANKALDALAYVQL